MWHNLRNTALLGTNRMTPSVKTLEELTKLGISIDEPTEATLTGIGTYALAQKAALVLENFEHTMPQTALEETNPYISAQSRQFLMIILENKYKFHVQNQTVLLELYAQTAYTHHKIAPPDVLPIIFTLAVRQMQTNTSAIPHLCGERGIWLWKYYEKTAINQQHMPSPVTYKPVITPYLDKEPNDKSILLTQFMEEMKLSIINT